MAKDAPRPGSADRRRRDLSHELWTLGLAIGDTQPLAKSELWRACADGSPVALVVPRALVRVPGGAKYRTDVHLDWAPDVGPELVAATPPVTTRVAAGPEREDLTRRNMWTARGRLGPVTVCSAPEGSLEIRDRAIVSRAADLAQGALRLRPSFVRARGRSLSALSPTSIDGVIAVPAQFRYSQTSTETRHDAFGSSSRRSLDTSVFRVHGGKTEVRLQQRGDERIRVHVRSDSPARLRAAWSQLRIALSVAADYNAKWSCWRVEIPGRQLAVLAGPPTDQRGVYRLPPIMSLLGPSALENFLRAACDAMDASPDIETALRVLETGRLARRPLTQGTLLVAAVVLEHTAKVACDAMGLSPGGTPLPAEVVSAVVGALDVIACEDGVRRRIAGMLCASGTRRGKDTLTAIHKEAPTLLSVAEIAAWDRIRHRLAHANFDQTDGDALDAFQRVANATHRLALRAVGYVGPYADHEPSGPGVRSI